jgi:response regulator RpfG family c-di-GMP phosphodiesterase
MRDFLERGLHGRGYRVSTASNGVEALRLLWQDPVDCIVSDIQMPEMDGMALHAAVRSDERSATIPFVAISILHDPQTMRRMQEMGAAAYLTKPFRQEQLVMLLERLLADKDQVRHALLECRHKEQRLLLGSVTSLVSALEARDGYTRSHSEGVARMVAAMGRALDLPAGEREHLETAGRLHDIGKIGIPDRILLKPASLSDEEYGVIKEHPAIGARILLAMPGLEHIAEMVRDHHERWDGSGYPAGLRGETIPLGARCIGVADAYSALTSDRPYRRRFSRERALEFVRAQRGRQFCPTAADLFLDVEPGFYADDVRDV